MFSFANKNMRSFNIHTFMILVILTTGFLGNVVLGMRTMDEPTSTGGGRDYSTASTGNMHDEYGGDYNPPTKGKKGFGGGHGMTGFPGTPGMTGSHGTGNIHDDYFPDYIPPTRGKKGSPGTPGMTGFPGTPGMTGSPGTPSSPGVGGISRTCSTESQSYTGICWSHTHCDKNCRLEGFPSGRCTTFHGACHCHKSC